MFCDIENYLNIATYLFFVCVKTGFSVESTTVREIRGLSLLLFWQCFKNSLASVHFDVHLFSSFNVETQALQC